MTVLAHAGHWIETLIYLAPLAALAAWPKLAEYRERMTSDKPARRPRRRR
jgi:hypothetical protein